MRILISILFCLFIHQSFSQTIRRFTGTGADGWTSTFTVAVPLDSASRPGKKYGVIFMHMGSGEQGSGKNTYANAVKYGPLHFINNGSWDGLVDVGDSSEYFFVVGLQLESNSTGGNRVWGGMNYFLYNSAYAPMADTMRIYSVGLSEGAQGIMASISAINEAYHGFTAAFPLSVGMSLGSSQLKNSTPWAQWGGRIGYMRGESDGLSFVVDSIISYMNAVVPSAGVGRDWTLEDAPSGTGHCCWNEILDPTKTYNITGGLTIYEWLSRHTKAPSASAQTDLYIDSDTVTLNGVTHGWNKVISWTTDGGANINSPSSDTTLVENIPIGVSTYNLKVTNGTNIGTFAEHIVTIHRTSNSPEFILTKRKLSLPYWFSN